VPQASFSRLGPPAQSLKARLRKVLVTAPGDCPSSTAFLRCHAKIRSRHDGGIYGCLTEGAMIRERALKAVLILVGLLFSAGVYPLTMFLSREPALAMMLSLYVTLGIFLLLAVRNPSANRSLIAFTAWSSFAHAAVMGCRHIRK